MSLFGKKKVSPSPEPDWVVVTQAATAEELGVRADEMTSSWTVQCAWCLAEQGVAAGSGSHGICTFHAAQLLAAHGSRRGR